MKCINSKPMGTLVGLGLLLGVTRAPAQITTPEDPTTLIGSDTLIGIMNDVMTGITLSGTGNGIVTYSGLGSSCGERHMEGSPSTAASEPFCLPTDANGGAEANPGCQEIAPMSRPMESSICEDDDAATNAEGLAICRDSRRPSGLLRRRSHPRPGVLRSHDRGPKRLQRQRFHSAR